jgi:hypothetical protein
LVQALCGDLLSWAARGARKESNCVLGLLKQSEGTGERLMARVYGHVENPVKRSSYARHQQNIYYS